MKIAIQGHPTRGKEVIKILESLGGVNGCPLNGNTVYTYYYIDYDCNNTIHCHDMKYVNECCKKYTLEEFEKEFPFKIGDEVIFPVKIGWASGKVTGLTYVEDQLKYEVDTRIGGYRYVEPHKLSLYPMKKERNITLTLEKAKEWYNKGGELKEIALQAFTEKELNPLPKTWKEFCEDYPVKGGECYLKDNGEIHVATNNLVSRMCKNWIPAQKSAEAHLAMMQLEQLRDCYRGLFVTVIGMPVWCIVRYKGELIISHRIWGTNETFLSFQSREVAEKYLKNFKPLIEQARDLI